MENNNQEIFYKTLCGKDGYLFLQSEVHQHYSLTESPDHERDRRFVQNYKQKKECLGDTAFFWFSIPDKSIVCREHLPIPSSNVFRYIDGVRDALLEENIEFCDLFSMTKNIDCTSYFKHDTHCNYKGGYLFSLEILRKVYGEEITNDLQKQMDSVLEWKSGYGGPTDLLNEVNFGPLSAWKHELLATVYRAETVEVYNYKVDNFVKDISDFLPEEFKRCGERESQLLWNDNGKGKSLYKKALFLCDSFVFRVFKDFIVHGFEYSLLYWDHGMFNTKLIEWYRPDIVLEIRVERFYIDIPIM